MSIHIYIKSVPFPSKTCMYFTWKKKQLLMLKAAKGVNLRVLQFGTSYLKVSWHGAERKAFFTLL